MNRPRMGDAAKVVARPARMTILDAERCHTMLFGREVVVRQYSASLAMTIPGHNSTILVREDIPPLDMAARTPDASGRTSPEIL